MVLIQVKEKDANKVFGILIHNGKFTGFKDNKFRIDVNEDETLKKIKKAKIEIEEL